MSQVETNWDNLLISLESSIRKGEHAVVVNHMKSLKIPVIPRPYRAPLADLARRASEPLLTLKILNAVLYPKNAASEPATDLEKITYASALPLLGLNEEALQILKAIDVQAHPEVLLYQSFAHFGRWNYQKPIPLLKSYIESEKISDYMRIVGRVNLIAAYTSQFEVDKARHWLQQSYPLVRQGGHQLLLGNLLELEAQTLIQEKKYAPALEVLEQAEKILRPSKGLYYELVRKWQYICRIMLNPTNKELAQQLIEYRRHSRKLRFWEISRDCDLYLAVAQENNKLLQDTVNGTPYASFHQRAERIIEGTIPKEKFFLRPLDEPGAIYDSQELSLLFQPTLELALKALAVDAYKPQSLGYLFRQVYKDEVFNPFSSPKRVMNTIYRLRKWLRGKGWQVSIEVQQLEFFLGGKGFLKIHHGSKEKASLLFHQFRLKTKGGTFNSRLFSKTLGISQRLAVEILREGVEKEKLLVSGKGRATIYAFNNYRKKEVI